jgi:hypothetical protein
MRVKIFVIFVATLLLVAASASAQVVSTLSSPPGSSAELLTRASRMAADTQRRFIKPQTPGSVWAHGTVSGPARPAGWR